MSAVKICPQCETRYEAELRFCPVDGATLKGGTSEGDLIGAVIADRYLVLEQLGEGGMGRVYLAEHVRMGRRSALKVMRPAMVHDADAIARFNREASNASRISHPNVAAIYDFGETREGLIYLAMEYVDGEPLTALIARAGALPPARAASIAVQVADALAAAHDMGIVHRDLKPDNIMLARGRDGADVVKVVDFGIAKATGGANAAQRVTRTGYIVGTPEYMSPEQLAGDPLDGRSDLYALGLVTFHMMTGTLPFPSATVQESIITRLTERPRTLAEARGGIPWPRELQAVLDRALARDAKHRYADARELRRDLLAAVARMPAIEASEAGTVLMSAPIPATRVAGSREVPAEASRAGVGPAPRRSRGRAVAKYGALAGGILVVAAGSYVMTRRDADDQVLPPSLASANAPDAGSRGDEQQGLGTPRGVDESAAASAAPPQGDDRASEPAVSPVRESRPAFNSRDALDSLARWLGEGDISEQRGRQGLDRVDALLPQLDTRADSVEALYRRAEAYAMLEKQKELCGTLDAIGGPDDLALVAPVLRRQIETLRNEICSPPAS